MKVVKKMLVPAEEVDVITYQCDVPGCKYETDDEDSLQDHFGKEHTVRAKKVILEDGLDPMISRSITLFWFEFEDHAQKWLDTTKNDWCEIRRVRWSGPGWYYESYDTQPCPKGCCQDQVVELESIEGLISDKRGEARRLLERADEIEKAIKVLEKPCFDED